MPERLLTTRQIADYCRVSRETVSQWIEQQRIPASSTPGGQHRVKLSDFRRFLEEQGMPVDPTFFNQDTELDIPPFLLTRLGDKEKESRYIVLKVLRGAAQAIAAQHAEEWAGWVTYLLEALDHEADEAEYRNLLQSLREGIAIRLEAGRWPVTKAGDWAVRHRQGGSG